MGRNEGSLDRRLILPESQWPRPGEELALDAEFVSVQLQETRMDTDGRQVVVK